MRGVRGGRSGRGGLAALVVVAVLGGCSAAGGTGATPGAMMQRGYGGMGRQATTSCTPTGLAGTQVNVVLADMGANRMMAGTAGEWMMLHAVPATVPAGQVSLVAFNHGWRTHELVVLPLAAGQRAGERAVGADGRISEAGSLGEASATCRAGEGDGIRAGSAGWVTLRLGPGRYELVCNLPHHYAAGMYQELDVQ